MRQVTLLMNSFYYQRGNVQVTQAKLAKLEVSDPYNAGFMDVLELDFQQIAVNLGEVDKLCATFDSQTKMGFQKVVITQRALYKTYYNGNKRKEPALGDGFKKIKAGLKVQGEKFYQNLAEIQS